MTSLAQNSLPIRIITHWQVSLKPKAEQAQAIAYSAVFQHFQNEPLLCIAHFEATVITFAEITTYHYTN
jgi:hypothetical protein